MKIKWLNNWRNKNEDQKSSEGTTSDTFPEAKTNNRLLFNAKTGEFILLGPGDSVPDDYEAPIIDIMPQDVKDF